MNAGGATNCGDPAPYHEWGTAEASLPAVFEMGIAAHRHQKAIGSGKWQPTYQELNAAADRIARFILSRGGSTGDRVALLMRHDAPLVASVLGVLKAGRMVVALNPSDPPARLGQICRDADPSLLLTDRAHESVAKVIANARIQVGHVEEAMASGAEGGITVDIASDAPAFLLYTSGSTGGPKGVIQTHRNVLHTVRGYSVNFGLASSDRIVLWGGIGGGQGVMTTFCALLNGATLYPYSLRDRGVVRLPEWLGRHKITVLISAATVFRQLANVMPGDPKLPRVRLVRLGSEPALRSDLESCRRLFSAECRFANVFSSTETGNLTQFMPDDSHRLEDGVLPVGVPVPGKQVLLLREDGSDAAQGEIGEIVVRSSYLSPGYWRDAAATQRVFRDVPGGDERIYLTGDLGRWRSDGLLEHLGRKDDQLKMMGNRIDVGEIDAALRSHPSICDAAVTATTDVAGKPQLLAWVVTQDHKAFDPLVVQETIRRVLPANVHFARITPVSHIPRTSNGKASVSSLLDGLDRSAPSCNLQPRTRFEERVARAWIGVLGHHPTSVYESFFEAGGDSLQAVDLMLALSSEFRQKLPPELLINFPSIAQLAEALEAGLVAGGREPWFRLPTATLLPLREEGRSSPLLFIPGGYTSENELLACAGLLVHLDGAHPASGVRLNLHARRALPPLSLQSLVRGIGRAFIRRHGSRVPVIIGECRACALACETARWLARRIGTPPRLILLDPWQPRVTQPDLNGHPRAVKRYYDLVCRHQPAEYPGEAHLVCPKESGRVAACLEWWRHRLGPRCIASEVPGNHHTYIRANKAHLAALLNGILVASATPGAGPTEGSF